MENMCEEEVMVYLRESLPGVILDLHDIASRKRQQAKRALRRLCERVNQDYKLQEALVSTTVACLAGASESIKAGAVHSLGLYSYALEDCEDLKARFIKIVLLLDNHSPQMARSIVKFLRLTIQGVGNPDILNQCFQYFITTILDSPVARAACRIRIRTLVEKLGKRFGWINLEKMIPEAHSKLFRYTRRMYNRRVRKAQAAQKRRGMKDSEDEDSDSDDSSEDEIEQEVCMVESEDRPVDLSSGKLNLIRKKDFTKRNHPAMKTNSDGRLVVEESDSDTEEAPVLKSDAPKRVSLSDLAELRDRSNALKKAQVVENATLVGGKRIAKRSKDESKSTKNSRRKHELSGLTQFAPGKKHAYGDSKRSTNDTDPYAYVRLNPSLIREKYRGNALEALGQVVRKTGEKAGRKMKKGRNGISGGLFLQKPVFKKQGKSVISKKNSRK